LSGPLLSETRRLRDRLEQRRSRELQKLTSLLQVSQALSGTLDLRSALQEVFDTLSRHHEAVGSLVLLADKESQEMRVEAAEGLGKAGHHQQALGASLIGKVADSGKQVVVPRMTLRVLDRAIQAHGAAGVSDDFPLASAWAHSRTIRLADGPDEVHREAIAKLELGKGR